MDTLRTSKKHWLLLPLLVGATALGCTGTPMPIPPSVDANQIAVTLETEPCEPSLGECVRVSGSPSATEPLATVFIHALRQIDMIDPVGSDTRTDESGAFDAIAMRPLSDVIRLIVHGESASTATNFTVDTRVPEPWPVVETDDAALGLCLQMSTDGIDFGDQTLGSTTTSIVDVTNTCNVVVSMVNIYMAPFTTLQAGDFGVLARAYDLDPGESMGVVVAFWPESVRTHFGVLLVETIDPETAETARMSLPVRGSVSR